MNITEPGITDRSTPFSFENEGTDIKRYLSLFISNWYWFAIALFFSITLAYGINRYSEDIYTVSSTLLIKASQFGDDKSGLSSIIPGGDIFKTGQNLNNEIGILKSFTLNHKVILELPEFQIVYVSVGRRGIAETKLYKACPFIVIPNKIEVQPKNYKIKVNVLSKTSFRLEINNGSSISRELNFGDRFNERGFDFVIRLRDSLNYIPLKNELSSMYYFYFEDPEKVANAYRSKLSIAPINEGATLVTLSVSGFVPSQESDYLNKLMEKYINSGFELKNATADSTISFINEQLGIISDSLSRAENMVEKFKLTNKIVDISGEGTLIKNKIDRYENEKSGIELQHKYFDYLMEYIKSRNETGDIISPSVIGITDPGLNDLVSNLAAAQKKKNQLRFNIDGKVPALDYAQNEIELARSALEENMNSSIKSLNISLMNVQNLISDADLELMKLPGQERQMINIQRKFDLNNTVYTYLLEKRAEAGIAMASTVSENRIVDRATSYNASLIYPNSRRNYFIAFLLGFLVPVFGIFLIDYLNNKIIDKRDVEKRTKVPILGFISHNDSKNEIPVIVKPGSTLAESFRSIRTALKYYQNNSESLVISISSTISSEGKTFISVNLAAIIALLGKKVLLVGLDLRKPRIHKVLDIENVEGMSSYLSGNCSYKDVIKKTDIKNLFYASAGQIPPNPAELIENEKMKIFFEMAKKEFDYIIIDTPPLAVVTDALLLTPYIDLNICVVRQRYSSKNTLELVDDLYIEGKFKNMAIIINDISLSGYYGYGLRYGYSMGYGYSYGSNYYGKYSLRYGYSDKGHGYYSED